MELLLSLWLLAALALGLPLARRALPGEDRLTVLLSYALLGGHALQVLALVGLWGLVPPGVSVYLTLALSLALGGLGWWSDRGRFPGRFSVGMGPLDTVVVALLLGSFGFLGSWAFTTGYSAGNPEGLFFHSAVVGWLGRGLYPPTNPLEPADPLQYRFGFHVLAAAVASATEGPPPRVLAATTGIVMALNPLAFVGASLRTFGGARPGIAASLLGLLGGSLLALTAFYRAFTAGVPEGGINVRGLLWLGNTLDMLQINVSIAMGFAAFTVALWLTWEGVARPKVNRFSGLLALASLAYLGLVNEVHFVILIAGLVAAGALRVLLGGREEVHNRRRWLLYPATLGLLAFLVVSFRGGLLGGLDLAGNNPGSLQMTLNTDHPGWVVGPPTDNPARPFWIPILSWEFLVDSDFWPLGLPVMLVLAWRARDGYVTPALLASAAAMAAWVSVHPRMIPADAYRFGQAAFTVYLSAIPFVVARVRTPRAWRSLRRWAQAAAFAALVGPHLAFAVWLIASPPPPKWAIPGSPDYQAGEYLRQSRTTWRVFVPLEHPRGYWAELYNQGGPGAAMRDLLALSAHALPIGHALYFHSERYLPHYRAASANFDPAALAALEVDWVYLLPTYLSPEQRGHLLRAQDRGDLALARSFGVAGTGDERLLLRVVSRETRE